MLPYPSILFLSLLISFSARAETKIFMTHFIKPFSYQENGSFKGFAVDIVKQLGKMQNITIEMKMYPFKRALTRVQNLPNTALFIAAKRPERIGTVKWVGPLITSGVYLYKNSKSLIHINNLSDAKKVNSIGVGDGNSDHTYLAQTGFTNLWPTSNQMLSLQMLIKNRIDLTPISEIVMPEIAKDAGIKLDEVASTKVKLYDSTLYIAFSYDTSDSEVLRWQQSLDQLKASGEYQKLFESYIQSP